ncbi:hypothetical protein C0J52_05701 [Blattella germanica]|nr:hypothetical protein C0J52_05701 [Blattella germanica]
MYDADDYDGSGAGIQFSITHLPRIEHKWTSKGRPRTCSYPTIFVILTSMLSFKLDLYGKPNNEIKYSSRQSELKNPRDKSFTTGFTVITVLELQEVINLCPCIVSQSYRHYHVNPLKLSLQYTGKLHRKKKVVIFVILEDNSVCLLS